jgi:hypothetical protein
VFCAIYFDRLLHFDTLWLMTQNVWAFTPLSCSLMSFLASCSHEWEEWTISEGGRGPLEPSAVSWVELSLKVGGMLRTLRSESLKTERAIEMIDELLSPNFVSKVQPELWKTVWMSDKFLSELLLGDLPAVDPNKYWKLSRGFKTKPTLCVLDA